MNKKQSKLTSFANPLPNDNQRSEHLGTTWSTTIRHTLHHQEHLRVEQPSFIGYSEFVVKLNSNVHHFF